VPADSSHSCVIVLPISDSSADSFAEGFSTCIPCSLSVVIFSAVSACDISHPRASAVAAACITALRWLSGSASSAAVFTITMFLGSHAWVSV
jgi:hypothetical protein